MKSCLYLIEYKNGDEDTMNQVMLEACIDNIFDTISKIVKQYRLHSESKKKYNMTLFTDEHTFTAEEYIEHYRNLPRDKYGDKVLDDFDIEIITMFN
jgi:hypothetical protein